MLNVAEVSPVLTGVTVYWTVCPRGELGLLSGFSAQGQGSSIQIPQPQDW